MKKSNPFLEYCLDMLAPIGGITSRALFGGYGLYYHKKIFAIIAYDRLFFKVDAHNRADFEAHGAQPFTYEKQGKEYALSYFELPEVVLEDQEMLRLYVEKAASHSQ
jgi:DNA transformation protein